MNFWNTLKFEGIIPLFKSVHCSRENNCELNNWDIVDDEQRSFSLGQRIFKKKKENSRVEKGLFKYGILNKGRAEFEAGIQLLLCFKVPEKRTDRYHISNS